MRRAERHLIVSGGAGLGVAALSLPVLLALGRSTSFLRLVQIVLAFPAVGLAGIGYATVVEQTVIWRAKRLEIEIWKALEAGPTTLWQLVEDRHEDDVKKLRTTLWISVVLLWVLGLLLVALGGAWQGLFVLALLTPALIAAERLATLSQSLPFRYRWKSFRAVQCVSLYTFMLLPVLLLGLGSLPLLGPDLALFRPLLIVSSNALFSQSVRNGLTALEERYGGITENPTRGDENPVPHAGTAASFRSVATLLFLVLGIGTGLAAVGLGIATLTIGLSIVVGGRAEGGCLGAFLFGAAAGPLGVAIATKIGWALDERVRHLALAPRRDRGGAELDALTRRGLFTEIKAALGAALMRCFTA